LLALALSACAGVPSSGPTGDVPADYRVLSGWTEDHQRQALPALARSCQWFKSGTNLKDPRLGSVADWRRLCAEAGGLASADDREVRRFFEKWFTPVAVGGGEEGLFTGYYEVELRGSWQRSARFNVPLYRDPGTRPLPERSQIVRGALAGRGLELMWVDDPIGAFFLQIQGSGRVVMNDGSLVGLHYAGQNGHAYYPIGRYLIDQGYATKEQMSLQLIRAWLKEHPDQANRVMDLNPSYVFFKIVPEVGARGAMNLELTPGRSLAIDRQYMPMGAPLWIDLKDAPTPGGTIRRLVLAQDTGGAIKGAVRGDLFWGAGPEAEDAAGVMKARGRYYLLVPRSAAGRL